MALRVPYAGSVCQASHYPMIIPAKFLTQLCITVYNCAGNRTALIISSLDSRASSVPLARNVAAGTPVSACRCSDLLIGSCQSESPGPGRAGVMRPRRRLQRAPQSSAGRQDAMMAVPGWDGRVALTAWQ
eukprot:768797-Hanusia_phi.AAC.1